MRRVREDFTVPHAAVEVDSELEARDSVRDGAGVLPRRVSSADNGAAAGFCSSARRVRARPAAAMEASREDSRGQAGNRSMKVDPAPSCLEARLNLSVLCTHARRLLLYYYILVSSRAATILGSPALWGRLVACGRLSIGQMSLTSSTPRLRLAAMRGRMLFCAPVVNRRSVWRIAGPPQQR